MVAHPAFPSSDRPSPSAARARYAFLLILAGAAGSIDAIGFLGLHHVFTANMTGNTVLLGLAIAQGQVGAALRSALVLLGYDLGVALGALIVERRQRPAIWPPAVTTAVAFEAVLLGVFGGGWYLMGGTVPVGRSLYLLILLSALAMGVQSAAVRRLWVPGVATTYVTGTLTSAAASLIDRLRGKGVPIGAAMAARGVGLETAVWGVYGLGAVIGGFAEVRWQAGSVALPFLAVLSVVAIAAHRF